MAKTAKKNRVPVEPREARARRMDAKPPKAKTQKTKTVKAKAAKVKPVKVKPAKVKTVKSRPAKGGHLGARRRPEPLAGEASPLVLDRLWDVVVSRRDADPATSHSARLLSRGVAKVAQKFGEEAVECLIEAVADNREALIGESADVLYHLLVLWVAAGLRPDQVWAELERREGISGVAEKASRARDLPLAFGIGTRKIP